MAETEKVWQRGVRMFPELRKKCNSMEEIAIEIGCTTAYIYTYIIPRLVDKTGIPHDRWLYQPQSKHVFLTKPGRPEGSKNQKSVVVGNNEATIQQKDNYSGIKENNECETFINSFDDIMNNMLSTLKQTSDLLKQLKETLEVQV